MRKSYVAFDCETTGVEDTDFITCMASIEVDDTGEKKILRWVSDLGKPLSSEIATKFILYLWDLNANKNYDIITFNGTSFDFKFIAKLIQDSEILKKLEIMALASEDIMLDFTTESGYFTSMQSFADGCNLKGKTNTGSWAATVWQTGTETEQKDVIEYCVEDVRVLCDMVDYREYKGKLYRTTKAGKRTLWVPMAETFRKSFECISTFESNPVIPSWMKKGTAPDIPKLWQWLQ